MNKASGVLGIGTFEHELALRLDGGRLAGVDDGRGEQPEAGVMMRVVVPGKEGLAPGAGHPPDCQRPWGSRACT